MEAVKPLLHSRAPRSSDGQIPTPGVAALIIQKRYRRRKRHQVGCCAVALWLLPLMLPLALFGGSIHTALSAQQLKNSIGLYRRLSVSAIACYLSEVLMEGHWVLK